MRSFLPPSPYASIKTSHLPTRILFFQRIQIFSLYIHLFFYSRYNFSFSFLLILTYNFMYFQLFAVYCYVSLYFSLFVSFTCVLVVLFCSYLDLCFYSRWIWGETPGRRFFLFFPFFALFFLFGGSGRLQARPVILCRGIENG